VDAYDFSATATVIDLGGGRGGLMAAILTKHPAVKGVLTDLPAVTAEAKAFLATQGLGECCAVVGCDLLAVDRNFSATRLCWSKGIGGGDAFMKLCLPSSGCETRPAKGEPAQAGSKPCADSRNGMGDA
jgi:hypothetical protein